MTRAQLAAEPAFFGGEPSRSVATTARASVSSRAAAVPRTAAVESWTLTADQVERWLKSARVGDELRYAHGPTLIDGAAAALVRRLAGEDPAIVYPFPRRTGPEEFDYVARLLRVRVVRPAVPAPPKVNAEMLAVLTVLQEAAAAKRRCPSDPGIAAASGLPVQEVKWQLRKMRRDRVIETWTVAAPGEPRFRIAKIVATGMETAGPEAGL